MIIYILISIIFVGMITGIVYFITQLIKLNKSQLNLISIINSLPGVVYQYKQYPDGRVEVPFISGGSTQLLDYTAAQVKDDPYLILNKVPEEYRQTAADVLSKSIKELVPYSFEHPYQIKDSPIRWLRFQSNPERLPDGSTLFNGILTDVTHEKELQLKLENQNTAIAAAQSELKNVTNCIPGMVYKFVKHADGKPEFTFFSDGAAEIFGYPIDELRNNPDIMLFSAGPNFLPEMRTAIQRSVEALSPFLFEHSFINKLGQLKWIRYQSNPTALADGSTLFYGILTDITKEKQLEALLLEQNDELTCQNEELQSVQDQLVAIKLDLQSQHDQLQSIINATDDYVIVINPDYTILYYNNAFVEYFPLRGITEFKRNDNLLELIQKYGKEGLLNNIKFWELAIQGSVVTQIEDFIHPGSGNTVVYSKTYRPMRNAEGVIFAICQFGRDITPLVSSSREIDKMNKDLLIINEQLINAKETALQAVEAKEIFLANVTHEIRTPLNGIIGLAHLLEGTTLDAKQREYMNHLNQSADILLTIVNDLLDLSAIVKKGVQLVNSTFSISYLINGLEWIFRPMLEAKNIAFLIDKVNIKHDYYFGDPGRLNQVFMNLLSNSAKFTLAGRVSFTIRVIENTEELHLLIFEVADTGIGIPSEYRPHLFDAFTDATRNTVNYHGGTGLGLSIVKKLVEAMGGEIEVSSEVGVGTKFTVKLVLKAVNDSIASSITSETEKERQLVNARLSALIVEDNAVNQMVMGHTLQEIGIGAEFAVNGLEAIERLKKNSYDLILMDVQMPVMDGISATEIIRTTLPEPVKSIPIIALTAYSFGEQREKCLMVGMNAYITKPVTADKLYEIIEDVIPQKKYLSHLSKDQFAMDAKQSTYSFNLLNEIFGNISDEHMEQLIRMIYAQVNEACIQLYSYSDKGKWGLIREYMHKFKTTLAYLGLNPKIDLLRPIRGRANQDLIKLRKEQMDNLISICKSAIHKLEIDFHFLNTN